jgi:hypothetical protein
MRRPHWRSAMFTAMSGAVGLTLLAGCATQRSGWNSAEETSQYLRNASGRYVIPGPPGDPWGPYVREASRRFDMPETWIRALMRQESGGHLYQSGRLITSSAGAMGLMQVMPGTYAELRARHNLGPDPFDPHENIMAGVAYMREMYDMYGSPGFLAAYNAGPNRLDDYLANQRSLPDETRHYVAAIGPSLQYTQPQRVSPAQQFAMNQLPLNIPAGTRYGYGSTVQYASAPAYSQPVFTQAAAQPVYSQPRAVAWAQPQPRPVYTAPAAQPAAVAWNAPAKPVYTAAPVQAYSPPPQRTEMARVEPRDEDESPARPSHGATRHVETTRVAFAALLPQHGSHLHLISSAMAAEVYTTKRGRKALTEPVSFTPAEHEHGHPAATWKLHANGPLQAPPVCHKNSHSKMVCGPERL